MTREHDHDHDHDTTLNFALPESAYEAAAEYPVMYRAVGAEPKTSHPFNCYLDIHDAPEALAATLDAIEGETVALGAELAAREIKRVLLTGMCSAVFLGQEVSAAFQTFPGVSAAAADAYEWLASGPLIEPGTALVGLSASGNSAETVQAMVRAREQGVFTIGLTCVAGSQVTHAGDAALVTAGGYNRAGVDTATQITRLGAAVRLALAWAEAQGKPVAASLAELRTMPAVMDRFLAAMDERIQTIMRMFAWQELVIGVASGANIGTAADCVLKFGEMGGLPARAMPVGELLHGGLNLVDAKKLLVLFVTPARGYERMRLAAEVTRLTKAPTVAIVPEGEQEIAGLADAVIRYAPVSEPLSPMLLSLAAWLLPYYATLAHGRNPDVHGTDRPNHARAWHLIFPPTTH